LCGFAVELVEHCYELSTEDVRRNGENERRKEGDLPVYKD